MEVAREKQLWQLLAIISVRKGDTVVGQDRLVLQLLALVNALEESMGIRMSKRVRVMHAKIALPADTITIKGRQTRAMAYALKGDMVMS